MPMRKKRVYSLAIGDEASMEDISTYSYRYLPDHPRGRHLSLGFLWKWEITNWGSKVSSPLEVTKLMKGWFTFLISSKEEVDMLLTSLWEMVGVPIVLHKWSPIFYDAWEKVEKEPIWVKLSGLPIHLWTPKFFKLLGNHLGEYVDAYFSFKITREMDVACVLVLLDLREGLSPDICMNIDYGDVN